VTVSRPRVEVRSVRGGLELRIDGTQASVHRAGRALTGVVWWALASPILLLPRISPRRVLVLGLAAGSVARAVRALDPDAAIVGVERDREVLRLARRHFDLDRLGVELVVGDALEYLRSERRRFDLIIEDLFVGPSRSVCKPDWLLGEGYRLIRKRLRVGGFVVSNTIHETRDVVRAMRPIGGRIVSLDVRGHWNRVTACGQHLPPPAGLRRVLKARDETSRILGRLALRTRGAAPVSCGGAAERERRGSRPATGA
jgi:precorrin-6B methylase 2